MSRDYKKTAPRTSSANSGMRKRKGGSTLLGLFIGVLLGLGIAAGAIYYLHRSNSPFKPDILIPKDLKLDHTTSAKENETEKLSEKSNEHKQDKPRFDFYRILPGTTEPKPNQPVQTAPNKENTGSSTQSDKANDIKMGDANALRKDNVTQEGSLDKAKSVPDPKKAIISSERNFLQTGAFQNSLDAEDLKAKLAFFGIEAIVQSVNVSDKGVWYRVRVGPYDNNDELNKAKAELVKRGFAAAVVKP